MSKIEKIKPASAIIACVMLIGIIWFTDISTQEVNNIEAVGLREIIAVKILPYIIENTWLKIIASLFLFLGAIGSWMQITGKSEEIK